MVVGGDGVVCGEGAHDKILRKSLLCSCRESSRDGGATVGRLCTLLDLTKCEAAGAGGEVATRRLPLPT